MNDKPEYCPWCQDNKGKTDLQFTIIDDDFAQYVKASMIKFCPLCGRKLDGRTDND